MNFRLFISLFLVLLLFSCENTNKDRKINKTKNSKSRYIYGICVDSLDIEENVVKKNEFLANIMLKKNIDYRTITYIEHHCKDIFDVRKIKPGQKYTFLITHDSIPTALYWIYEINKIDFAVFGLTDSLPAWIGHKKVITKIETTEGTISTSLWNSMMEHNCDPYLTIKLSDIYAWTIDFFGIQPGDSYKIIYENRYINDKPIETGKILAASINNNNSKHYAFCFKQGDEFEYFDENGENLRKAFLKAPLNYRRISSTFSEARLHPITKKIRPHHGVDYAAPTGTPVQSIGDGTVIDKGYQKNGGGNYLKIKHNSTYTSVYMHLNSFAKGIKKGSKVKQGDLIGYVGNTGLATGPHLDFRLIKNGIYINPLTFKSPSGDPVKDDNREKFYKDVKTWIGLLDQEK